MKFLVPHIVFLFIQEELSNLIQLTCSTGWHDPRRQLPRLLTLSCWPSLKLLHAGLQPKMALGSRGSSRRGGWYSNRRLARLTKEDGAGEQGYCPHMPLHTSLSSEPWVRPQFLVSLKVFGTQISKLGIRNVQSLFEDFLEFGALWFLLFRKALVACLSYSAGSWITSWGTGPHSWSRWRLLPSKAHSGRLPNILSENDLLFSTY